MTNQDTETVTATNQSAVGSVILTACGIMQPLFKMSAYIVNNAELTSLQAKQEHRKAGNIRPKGLYQKMGAKFRLLKPKGQEQEREHIQQKKAMMLSEFWLHFNIEII